MHGLGGLGGLRCGLVGSRARRHRSAGDGAAWRRGQRRVDEPDARTRPPTAAISHDEQMPTPVSQDVASHTPRAGPAMKDSSVAAESSDRAVRRCASRAPSG